MDQDGSGAIEAAEMAAAAEMIAKLDLDDDQCISFEEVNPLPPPPPPNQPLMVGDVTPERTSPTIADMLRDVREPLLSRRLIKKYDRNRDGELNEKEFGGPAPRFKTLDINNDQKLSERELAGIGETTPDLEIAVELSPADDRHPWCNYWRCRDDESTRQTDATFARVAFATAVVSVSCRQIDSVRKALDNAMDQFNLLDIDGNGYIDSLKRKKGCDSSGGCSKASI